MSETLMQPWEALGNRALYPSFRVLLASGQRHTNRLCERHGYTLDACRALLQSPLWQTLDAQLDAAALAGNAEAVKVVFRLQWAVVEGPSVEGGAL